MTEIVVSKKVEDVNKCEFVGIMIGRKESTRCLTVYFRCMTRQGAKSFNNSLMLLSFDPQLNVKASAIPLRTKVRVTGYVTSSRKKAETSTNVQETTEDTKNTQRQTARGYEDLEQNFVFTNIETVDSETPDVNQVEIVGTVNRAFVSRSGNINFIINTVRENRYFKTIHCVAFPKEEINYISMMAAGTKIWIHAHCSVRSVNNENEAKYIETLIIDESTRV